MRKPVTTPENLRAEAEMLARLNARFKKTLGNNTLEEIFELDHDSAITLEQIQAIEAEYGLQHRAGESVNASRDPVVDGTTRTSRILWLLFGYRRT